jgi:hypothetical protein
MWLVSSTPHPHCSGGIAHAPQVARPRVRHSPFFIESPERAAPSMIGRVFDCGIWVVVIHEKSSSSVIHRVQCMQSISSHFEDGHIAKSPAFALDLNLAGHNS